MHFLRIFIMSAVVWFEMRPGVCRLFCFQTQERKIILLFVGAVGKRHWGGPERQAGWPSAPLQAGSMQYGASVGKEARRRHSRARGLSRFQESYRRFL